MVRAGCAATSCAPAPRPSTPAESQWQNHRGASATRHSSLVTRHCRFLIGSHQLLEIGLTHSQQTRKHFLIGSFSALSLNSCLVKPSPCHSGRSLERRNRAFSADDTSSESQWPWRAGSLTVMRRSSKLLVSTGPAIRSSARVKIKRPFESATGGFSG
jgi:hypothetical protein